MSLTELAAWAEIVGASTIVTGLIFGYVQLRHLRSQRRDAVAQSLAQTFYNRDLARAIAMIQNVPDDVGLEALREMGQEYEEAAVTVTTSFETMGVLVYKRIATLSLVADLAGGIIMTMNRKLGRVQEELRVELKQPSWAEWFTWLSEQVERVKGERPPAHEAHSGWRP